MGNTKMCLGIIHQYEKKTNKEKKKKAKEQKYKDPQLI
jgi:hypothetical protein